MDFNQSMSSVRESVEWLFNDVTNNFKFLDLKKKQLKNLVSVVWVKCMWSVSYLEMPSPVSMEIRQVFFSWNLLP